MYTAGESLAFVFLLLLSTFAQIATSFFDVDEINSVNYGIDILDVPVVRGQEKQGGSVFLASRFGQQYQCTFVEKSLEDELKQKEEEKVAMEMGIAELLKSMENGPCLVNTKGWWTYEFCFGKYIKQFHLEGDKIAGSTLYLGHYHSDYDWSNTTQLRKQRSWLSRYHTQQYVNGTLCDLTGKSRRAEVRFFCEQTPSDYVSRVDETETCVYTISVQTSRICNHPYLKPPAPTKAIPITCNPLLSEREYDSYMDMMAAEKEEKLMKEKIIESNAKMATSDMEDGILRYSADGNGVADAEDGTMVTTSDEDAGGIQTEGMAELQNLLSKTLMEELKGVLGDAVDPDIQVSEMKVKKIKNPGDVDAVIKDVLKSVKSQGKKSKGIAEEKKAREDKELESAQKDGDDEAVGKDAAKEEEEEDEGKVKDDAEDEETLLEFDKGLDDLVETEGHLKQIKDYKETLQQEINAQFDDILQEAEAELQMDLDGDTENVDTDQALKTMSETLKKLMNQLEKKTMKKSALENKEGEDSMGHVDTATKDDEDAITMDTEAAKDGEEEDEEYVNMEYDLKYGEHKIQVKIFTSADYYEEATADMLEGGTALNKMIVAVLGGNTDEIKEAHPRP